MWLTDLIVGESPSMKDRKLLDVILYNFENGLSGQAGIEDINYYSRLIRILVVDGYVMLAGTNGYMITPENAKFDGYVSQYKSILVKKVLVAIWSLLVSIIVPLAVAYFTVKFTVPNCP